MNREYEMVRQFHMDFGSPVGDLPRMLTEDRVRAREDWMREEVQEFVEAKDLCEQADAMIDLIYFALGTLVEMGVEPDELFEIVHNANMAKKWPDGKVHRNEMSKVIKPSTWEDPEPKLKAALKRQMERRPEK